eukprot:1051597-Pelagomonas_calceolata.AAC.1
MMLGADSRLCGLKYTLTHSVACVDADLSPEVFSSSRFFRRGPLKHVCFDELEEQVSYLVAMTS